MNNGGREIARNRYHGWSHKRRGTKTLVCVAFDSTVKLLPPSIWLVRFVKPLFCRPACSGLLHWRFCWWRRRCYCLLLLLSFVVLPPTTGHENYTVLHGICMAVRGGPSTVMCHFTHDVQGGCTHAFALRGIERTRHPQIGLLSAQLFHFLSASELRARSACCVSHFRGQNRVQRVLEMVAMIFKLWHEVVLFACVVHFPPNMSFKRHQRVPRVNQLNAKTQV